MFTGIIEEVGRVTSIAHKGGGRHLTVAASHLVKELKKGDSIAVSGVCLTAVEITPTSFSADLAEETWNRTSFSRMKAGALVNLELPMRADGRFSDTLSKATSTVLAGSPRSTKSPAPTAIGCASRFRQNWHATLSSKARSRLKASASRSPRSKERR